MQVLCLLMAVVSAAYIDISLEKVEVKRKKEYKPLVDGLARPITLVFDTNLKNLNDNAYVGNVYLGSQH